MLINLTNHQSGKWTEIQRKQAINMFVEVADLDFPDIDPNAEPSEVFELAEKYKAICIDLMNKRQNSEDIEAGESHAVHLMGEMTFTFALVNLLQNAGLRCVASTTRRRSIEKGGVTTSVFEFVQFRDYPVICR